MDEEAQQPGPNGEPRRFSQRVAATRLPLLVLGLAALAGWSLMLVSVLGGGGDGDTPGDAGPVYGGEAEGLHAHTVSYQHTHSHTHADGTTHTDAHTHQHHYEHSHPVDGSDAGVHSHAVDAPDAGGHGHAVDESDAAGRGHAADESDVAAAGQQAPSPEAAAAAPSLEDRTGEVHVHSDGLVHTHGAGAPETWTVTYTSEGLFVPERIDVPTGDTVTFVNASDDPVWPASNIHPTHEILPDFDPLGVIWPGESWSHTFDKNGYWRYHNHIEANQTGLVVSTGGPDEALEPLLADMQEPVFLPVPAGAGGAALFDDAEQLREFVELYGPAAAVVALKAVELDTGRYCHDAAHEAGRLAYEIFGPVSFAISGHECQAGALHGSTEAMFAARGTSRLAEDVAALCSRADNRFVRHQCYHGVGHGLMAWTTYEIHEALEQCDVIERAYDASSCYSGVFMENVVGGLSGVMGHETEYLRADDPHFPCDVIESKYRADCYYYQTSHMWRVFDGDMSQIAGVCAALEGRARDLCFSSYGRDVGNQTRGDPAGAIELCGHAPAGEDRVECISGSAQDRFWETTGADEAISLCSMLTDPAETESCWWTIIDRAGDVFVDEAGRRGFCDRIPDDRRPTCLSEIVA